MDHLLLHRNEPMRTLLERHHEREAQISIPHHCRSPRTNEDVRASEIGEAFVDALANILQSERGWPAAPRNFE